jgi:hypothetical protein
VIGRKLRLDKSVHNGVPYFEHLAEAGAQRYRSSLAADSTQFLKVTLGVHTAEARCSVARTTGISVAAEFENFEYSDAGK